MLISPLLAVVVIVSLSIIMSSTNTFPIFASDQLSNDVPNLYVLSILGTISLSILALILIVQQAQLIYKTMLTLQET